MADQRDKLTANMDQLQREVDNLHDQLGFAFVAVLSVVCMMIAVELRRKGAAHA
jgi:hypothetical protein